MSWYDPWGIASTTYHMVTGAPTAADRRAQQQMMQAQINAYNKQSQITQQEIDAKKNSEDAERRRVEEKQIRALRGSYSAGGNLSAPDSVASNPSGMTDKLGG